jgi:hypothetical protein
MPLDEIDSQLVAWRRYAAAQPDAVGALLRLVRERLGQTEEEQRQQLGVDSAQFLRLCGFRQPRLEQLTGDAHRIAIACGLAQPFHFVSILRLACSWENTETGASATGGYRAALDHDTALSDDEDAGLPDDGEE